MYLFVLELEEESNVRGKGLELMPEVMQHVVFQS